MVINAKQGKEHKQYQQSTLLSFHSREKTLVSSFLEKTDLSSFLEKTTIIIIAILWKNIQHYDFSLHEYSLHYHLRLTLIHYRQHSESQRLCRQEHKIDSSAGHTVRRTQGQLAQSSLAHTHKHTKADDEMIPWKTPKPNRRRGHPVNTTTHHNPLTNSSQTFNTRNYLSTQTQHHRHPYLSLSLNSQA